MMILTGPYCRRSPWPRWCIVDRPVGQRIKHIGGEERLPARSPIRITIHKPLPGGKMGTQKPGALGVIGSLGVAFGKPRFKLHDPGLQFLIFGGQLIFSVLRGLKLADGLFIQLL